MFFSEYRLFANEEITKEMIIDNDQTATTMRVNINFTFLRVPCLGNTLNFIWIIFKQKGLSLDQEDEIGNHILDVSGTLKKIRLNEKEEIIREVVLFNSIILIISYRILVKIILIICAQNKK